MTISLAQFFVAALAASTATALPHEKRQSSCTAPKQRRAWHTMSDEDKRAYIQAEQCLMNTDANLGLYAAVTKFDELQSIHVMSAEITHQVGAFLPYHRLLMYAHEALLESECGYTDGQPYWHEVQDSGNFANSVVLDPDTGFGGNGASAESPCIQDGPFSNYVNRIGLGYTAQDQCITRSINETASALTSPDHIRECLDRDSWLTAWPCIEASPHFGGHSGMGGQMRNPVSSPGDPLFYLHHTWLDKVWWEWQKRDLPGRLEEMGGPNRQRGATDGEEPCGGEQIFGPLPDELERPQVQGDPGCGTTLDHVLQMHGVVVDRTIRDVMNIQGDVLCYEYVDAN